MMFEYALAHHAWLLLFFWVPFAVLAGFIDTRDTEGGRAFRRELAHPIRGYRRRHPLAFKRLTIAR
jgi:hypothetical protein